MKTAGLLKGRTKQEYLASKLDCPLETIEYLFCKKPVFKGKCVITLDKTIDALLDVGVTGAQIIKVPSILLFSRFKMVNRICEYKSHGLKLDKLFIFITTDKQFEKRLKNLIAKIRKTSDEIFTQEPPRQN